MMASVQRIHPVAGLSYDRDPDPPKDYNVKFPVFHGYARLMMSSRAAAGAGGGHGRRVGLAAWLRPGDTVFGTDKPSERETPVQR
jgi:hypothetical protein